MQSNIDHILLYGDEKSAVKLLNYLGLSPRGSALVYLKFPGPDFKNKEIVGKLGREIVFYYVKPSFLQATLMQPKIFRNIKAIISVSNNDTSAITQECVEFFKKYAQITNTFVPILFIGYNHKGSKWNLGKFYFDLEVSLIYREIFNIDTLYFNVFEGYNEHGIPEKIKQLLETADRHHKTEYTPVTVELMIKSLKERLSLLRDNPPRSGIPILARLEELDGITLTRKTLVDHFGLKNEDARDIIDLWESPPLIREDDSDNIDQQSLSIYQRCIQISPNISLLSLLKMNIEYDECKKILHTLKKMGKIDGILYHTPPREYKEYKNIDSLLVYSAKRTIHAYELGKSEEEEDNSTLQLVTALVSAIIITREEYLKKYEEKKNVIKMAPAERLELGNFFAILSRINDLDVVLVFKERPPDIFLKKVREFAEAIIENFGDLSGYNIMQLDQIKKDIIKLFYEHFNPLPRRIRYSRIFKVNPDKMNELDRLTELEKTIIEVVKEEGEGIKIEDIIEKVSEKTAIDDSNIYSPLIDLINEKYLI